MGVWLHCSDPSTLSGEPIKMLTNLYCIHQAHAGGLTGRLQPRGGHKWSKPGLATSGQNQGWPHKPLLRRVLLIALRIQQAIACQSKFIVVNGLCIALHHVGCVGVSSRPQPASLPSASLICSANRSHCLITSHLLPKLSRK